MPAESCSEILAKSYRRASAHLGKSFLPAGDLRDRVEGVALCLKNRAGVRALLACLLAKVHDSKVDIRKPYTDITGDSGEGGYSGRVFDEGYVQRLLTPPYDLPMNQTTAFLTPGFRTKNIVLTTNVRLEGRPAGMYEALLQLLGDVHAGRISARRVMDEAMRLLILERNQRQESIRKLVKDIRRTVDQLPLSAEEIVNLVAQHLGCKHSSRLPVLIIAAAYQVASERLGERILQLHAHNAADKQTGSAGDIEITLIGESGVVTAYEMKMKPVTTGDIDIALQKIAEHKDTIQNYIFVSTERIDPEVREYAARRYDELGGIEIAVLNCLGFLRHFLHLFYRLRTAFLDAYQELLLNQPDSAVSHTLKEAFLSLRKVAEGAR